MHAPLVCTLTTGMENVNDGFTSIILADQGLIVKMLITLEPQGIFKSNYAY